MEFRSSRRLLQAEVDGMIPRFSIRFSRSMPVPSSCSSMVSIVWKTRWKRKSHRRANRDVNASQDSFSPTVSSRLPCFRSSSSSAPTRSCDSRSTSAAASMSRTCSLSSWRDTTSSIRASSARDHFSESAKLRAAVIQDQVDLLFSEAVLKFASQEVLNLNQPDSRWVGDSDVKIDIATFTGEVGPRPEQSDRPPLKPCALAYRFNRLKNGDPFFFRQPDRIGSPARSLS